jgi:phage nucleotide-binding protein
LTARIDTVASKTRKPELTPYLSTFIYGDSGVGKTYFCGTAADHVFTAPVLIIDCEGGTATLRHRQENVDVIRVKTIKEIDEIHEALFFAKPEELKWKTVALDSLDEIQDIDMRFIMRLTKQHDDTRDEEVPAPREWGKSRTHMRTLVRAFRDLPMHTIITSLANEKEKEGRPTQIIPNLSGKVAKEIPGFVGVVGYYYKDKAGDRILQLESTQKVPFCKTRFPELGQLIKNPTFPMMYETIYNSGGSNGNVARTP